ncbi:MAG: hypothetical protein M3N13_06075 [Candidatus Eremiobacteraeota bacterium]|nr:hypothetical protein [Candidatus Eremiobacteraeota bacterium]
MSFILKWLRPQTSFRIGLRPHRTVQLDLGFDAAYERVLAEIEGTLGANVYVDDRAGKIIEAGFGLINNERVRTTLEEIDTTHTAVRIEAFYLPGAAIPEKSSAVEALASALVTGG